MKFECPWRYVRTKIMQTLTLRCAMTAFFALSIGGLVIIPDFGIGFDEVVNRRNGEVSFNYIKDLVSEYFKVNFNQQASIVGSNLNDLNTYQDRDYGVAFDLPAYAIERFFSIESSYYQYLLRHGLTYLIFLSGCVAIYETIRYRHRNSSLAVFAVIILICSPRIFGDAFHNSKDISFMSVYAITTYCMIRFFSGFSLKASFLFAVATALAINLRIIGVIFPIGTSIIFALHLFSRYSQREVISYGFYLTACFLLTIAFWPWLWENPVDNFITAFTNMSRFRWDGWVLYFGELYPVRQLPWHYLPVWVGISTPLLYILLFIIGVASALKFIFIESIRQIQNITALQDLIILGLFLGPVLLVLISKPVIYDGWRQFYFLYPSFVYLVIRGLSLNIDNNLIRHTYYFCTATLGFVTILTTIIWMFKAHPYQSIYLNSTVPKSNIRLFELDYWGISNIELLRFLVQYQPEGIISVWGLGITSLGQSSLMLPLKEQARIQAVPDISSASYVLTNYRLLEPNQQSTLKSISTDWNNLFDIRVDGRIIASVFIRSSRL
jgi:hypothetical protein